MKRMKQSPDDSALNSSSGGWRKFKTLYLRASEYLKKKFSLSQNDTFSLLDHFASSMMIHKRFKELPGIETLAKQTGSKACRSHDLSAFLNSQNKSVVKAESACNPLTELAAYVKMNSVEASAIGYIYEAIKANVEKGMKRDEKRGRRRKGSFYTPSATAEYITRNALEDLFKIIETETEMTTPSGLNFYLKRLRSLRILDPACGCGIFPLMTAQILKEEEKRILSFLEKLEGKGLPKNPEEKESGFPLSCLYGIDLDSDSLERARLSLIVENYDSSKQLDIKTRFIRANALLKGGNEKTGLFGNETAFDLMLGNPPYGSGLYKEDKDKLKERFPSASDYESSQYFTLLASKLLRDGGICSYIVPNTLFLNVGAEFFRKKMRDEGTFYRLIDLSEKEVFKGAKVRCVIFSWRKKTDDSMTEDPFSPLHPKNADSEDLTFELRKNTIPLGKISISKQGYIPYRTTTLTKRHGPQRAGEIVKGRLFHSKEPLDEFYKKELQGRDVERYSIKWSGTFVRYGPWVSTYVNERYFRGPRILIREITSSFPQAIKAAYTDETFVHNPSILNSIITDKRFHPLYITAVLNSTIGSTFFLLKAPKSKKGLFPRMLLKDMREIPIKIVSMKKQKEIASMVHKLINEKAKHGNNAETEKLDREIDAEILKIYETTKEEVGALFQKY